MTAPSGLLRQLADVVGPGHLLTDTAAMVGQATDWTGRMRGTPVAIARPGSVEEVAGIVSLAREHALALVPQGGNTGLVGGATPGAGELIVDCRRLGTVTDQDQASGQLTAGAGVTIASVQGAARDGGWAYGVDWAARETATVGGSVATDAGGLRFVRHGSTRRQLLGVEAVLGTGAIVSHLPRVEKDNTGYDLAALLCGSEGTLGIITAARLRLVAPSGPLATALVGFADVAAAIAAATDLRRSLPGLEAVEFMLRAGIELVADADSLPDPLGSPCPAALLVETGSSGDPASDLADVVAALVGVTAAAVAVDGPAQRRLWAYREGHTLAIARLGSPHKFDVTLPAGELATFVDEIGSRIAEVAPVATTWLFGHAADGNVHVNVTGLDPDDVAVADVVLGEVAARGGSISAEHGIGRAKRQWLHLARSVEEIAAMRAIKAALDPAGICNPGALFPS